MSKGKSKPLGRLHSVLIELMAIADELDTPMMPNEASEGVTEAIHGILDAMGELSSQQYGKADVKPKPPKDRQTTIKEALPANGQSLESPSARK
jgi:hypothetical protein